MHGVGLVDYLRVRIEDVEDALGGGGGVLEAVVEAAQALHRSVEAVHVAGKGDKVPQGQLTGQDVAAPDPPDDDRADGGHEGHDRAEEAAHPRHPQLAPQQVQAAALELAHFPPFLGEGLDHAHPRDGIGEEGAEAGPAAPQRPVDGVQLPAEAQRRPHQQRRRQQHEGRQPGIEPKEDDADDDQGEHIADGLLQAVADEILQAAHVLGDAGHDASGLVLGVVTERQRVEMGVYLVAQTVGDALADAGHDIAPQGRQEADGEVDPYQQAHQPGQDGRLVALGYRQESEQIKARLDVRGRRGTGIQDIVDENPQQQRLAQADGRGHHHERQAEGDEPPVRPGIAQQPEEQLALFQTGRAYAVAARNDLAAAVAAFAPGPGSGQSPVEHLAVGFRRAGLADQAFDLIGQIGQRRHQALGENGHGRSPLPGADLEGRGPQILAYFHPPYLGQGQGDQVGGAAAVGAEGHQEVVGGQQPCVAVAAVELDVRGHREAELFVGA